jgi:hypothetical protein
VKELKIFWNNVEKSNTFCLPFLTLYSICPPPPCLFHFNIGHFVGFVLMFSNEFLATFVIVNPPYFFKLNFINNGSPNATICNDVPSLFYIAFSVKCNYTSNGCNFTTVFFLRKQERLQENFQKKDQFSLKLRFTKRLGKSLEILEIAAILRKSQKHLY